MTVSPLPCPGEGPGMRVRSGKHDTSPGFRITVEMYEASDANGNPVVVVVKSDAGATEQRGTRAAPSGNGRRRGRPKKQPEAQATDNYDELRDADGMSETME